MKTPDTIEVEITEEDRQKADKYEDPKRCLLCAALKRMKYKKVSVDCVGVTIGAIDYRYTEASFNCTASEFNHDAKRRPFYRKSVVGMRVTLTRVK